MSVISFKEIHSGRDGAEDLGGKDQQVRRYSRVFRAKTNSNDDEAEMVLASAPCPRIGHVYPNDLAAYCRRRRARNESCSKRVWIVTCAYSSEHELEENPLNDPAKITWTTEQFQTPYYKDVNNNPILNKANDLFDPLVDGDDSRWTAVVRKNVAVVPTWLLLYRDAVNSDEFTLDGLTIEPNEAKMQAIEISEEQERNDIKYRALTMRIQLKWDDRQHGIPEAEAVWKGWTKQILNAGLYQLREIGTLGTFEKVLCLDSHEVDAVIPFPLDEDGLQVPHADLPGAATYIDADIYREKPFSALPLT